MASWEQDQLGAYFDPASLLPGENPQIYEYSAGYSKRTLLGGYLPVADIGVWNPRVSVWLRNHGVAATGN